MKITCENKFLFLLFETSFATEANISSSEIAIIIK